MQVLHLINLQWETTDEWKCIEPLIVFRKRKETEFFGVAAQIKLLLDMPEKVNFMFWLILGSHKLM